MGDIDTGMNISVMIYNSNEPLPKQGGMERVTDALTRGLLARGVKVILLCKTKNRLNECYNPPCSLYFMPEHNCQNFIQNLLVKHNITHIIDQAEGEIVGKFGYFKTRYECFKDIKLIAVQHSSARTIMRNYKQAFGRNINNLIWRFVYNNLWLPILKLHSIQITKRLHHELGLNYDKIVMLSPSFVEDFVHYYPKIQFSKLIAIPDMNSYEVVEYVKKQDKVLFVGRLISNVKGCDKLLRIWKEATINYPDWHLDIVGDGPDREKLEVYARELGISNCTFHGFQNPTSFYQSAKIFCMTSIYEGFGMVLTEAMQHGVVPLAFDSYKSVRDIISDNSDGFVIPKFNEKQYAEKLRYLISNNQILDEMSKRAQVSVKQFSTETIINRWISLLKETSSK